MASALPSLNGTVIKKEKKKSASLRDNLNFNFKTHLNLRGKPISKKSLPLQVFFVYTSRSRCPPFLFIFDERIVKQSKSPMLQNDIYK